MATLTTITSRDNPRLKNLRLLATNAREIYQQGLTLIDGPHLISSYLAAIGVPKTLLVSQSGLDNAEIRTLIEQCATETLAVADGLFRQLSGTMAPVGLLAVIDIPPGEPAPVQASCVLLDAVQDPGNVGAILRTALAAGIRDVILSPGCAGAWTPRVLRAAQGAHFGLRISEQQDLASLLTSYKGISIVTVARGGQALYQLDLRANIAWLFGNEGQGVSTTLSALAARAVTIPLHAPSESLNVAAAAAICLFEEVRQKSFQGEEK